MYIIGILCSINSNILEMMEKLLIFFFIVVILAPICWMWVSGFDYMNKNHPDYKGDDLFGEFDENDKNQIG